MKVPDNTRSEEINKVGPVKTESAASLVSALDHNARKSVSVRQFSCGNHLTADIVVNLDEMSEVPYPLSDVQEEHEQNLRVSVQRNGFGYSRGVHSVTLRNIVVANDTEI